jgi:hypothetical protein
MARELRTTEGINAQMFSIQAKLEIMKKHPEYYMNLSNPLASNAKMLDQRIKLLQQSMKGQKPEVQLKAYQDLMSELGVTPAPSTTSSSPAPDSPMGY